MTDTTRTLAEALADLRMHGNPTSGWLDLSRITIGELVAAILATTAGQRLTTTDDPRSVAGLALAAAAPYVCRHDDRSGYHSGESGLIGDLIFAGAPPSVVDHVAGWVNLIERQTIECFLRPDQHEHDWRVGTENDSSAPLGVVETIRCATCGVRGGDE